MGLGLIHGRSTPDADAKVTMYNTASDLWAKFEAEYGTVNCKELTGCDMMTPEGAEEFAAKDMHNTLCHKFVLWCVEQVIADI